MAKGLFLVCFSVVWFILIGKSEKRQLVRPRLRRESNIKMVLTEVEVMKWRGLILLWMRSGWLLTWEHCNQFLGSRTNVEVLDCMNECYLLKKVSGRRS